MRTIRMSDVLELSVLERMQLVQDIWDTIHETSEDIPLTEGERCELDRRLTAAEQNPEATSPWSDVRARLLART